MTAGDPGSPVIVHVPHAARLIPDAVRRRILLAPDELDHELDLMTDAHTDVLARAAADAAARRPWVFTNPVSRLVVDPERFPDEREEMAAVGMAAVYTHSSHRKCLRRDDAQHRQRLLEQYFDPYARGLAALVDQRLAQTGRAVIVDVHSYPSKALPYELHPHAARPQLCVGTDPLHTADALVGLVERSFAGLESCRDEPFAGCYVPLPHYRRDPNVQSIMLEIRRDVYMSEPGGAADPAAVRMLARSLTAVVDSVSYDSTH